MLSEIFYILLPYFSIKLFLIRDQIFNFIFSIPDFLFDNTTTVTIEDKSIIQELKIFFSKADHSANVLTILSHQDRFSFIPHNDTFIVRYNNQSFYVRLSEKQTKSGNLITGNSNIYFITVEGRNKEKLIYNFVKNARESTHSNIVFYNYNKFYWRRNKVNDLNNFQLNENKFQDNTKENESSLILNPGVFEALWNYIKDFNSSKQNYIQLGIPYRLGILLHGVQGSGKLTTVIEIAKRLGKSIASINLDSDMLDDETLYEAMIDLPDNSLIIFRGIDKVFNLNRNRNKNYLNRITFSGLLNTIDGISSKEGTISFFIAHNISNIDPALIRPGRCDYIVKYDYASKYQIEKVFKVFYPDASESLVNMCISTFPEYSFPIRIFQSHFLNYKNDPVNAIKKYKKLFKYFDKDGKLDYSIKSLTLKECLTKLGLSYFTKHAYENDLFTVKELFQNNNYSQIVKNSRIIDILEKFNEGDKKCLDKMKILSKVQLEQEITSRFQNINQSKLKFILDELENVQVSLFQIEEWLHNFESLEHCIEGIKFLTEPPQDLLTFLKLKFRVKYENLKIKEFLSSISLDREEILNHISKQNIQNMKELALSDLDWDNLSKSEIKILKDKISQFKNEAHVEEIEYDKLNV